ncbi:hypothetical protein CC2G_004389 [Coprinopsis cinerea AmutBmut pab1-1]|nr:hypothetical protein CC2G_004389 [Coprinopsis cinerea AmutBmut pab1-1]
MHRKSRPRSTPGTSSRYGFSTSDVDVAHETWDLRPDVHREGSQFGPQREVREERADRFDKSRKLAPPKMDESAFDTDCRRLEGEKKRVLLPSSGPHFSRNTSLTSLQAATVEVATGQICNTMNADFPTFRVPPYDMVPEFELRSLHSSTATFTAEREGRDRVGLPVASIDPEFSMDDPVLLGGPVFVGSLLAYLLYGALLVQFFHYLCELPSKASWAGPAVAGLVVIVETLSVCFIAQMGWSTVVIPLRGSSVDNLSEFPASSSLNPVLNGLAACIVQLCFAHRIWRLSRSSWGRYVAAVVAFLTVSQFADTIVIAVQFWRLNNRLLDSSKARTMQIVVAVYLGVTLTCDIMITVAMILILRKYKQLTTFHSTKRILNTLTVHTIENGLVTSICAAVNLVLYFARPGDAIHIVFQFIIGRLHANVLLAHLNHQIVVRNAAATETIELSARENAPGTVVRTTDPSNRGPDTHFELTVLSSMRISQSHNAPWPGGGGRSHSRSSLDVDLDILETKRDLSIS